MEQRRYLTYDQFRDISWFKDQLNYCADDIKTLCQEERPKILCGFELGKVYNWLSVLATKLLELDVEVDKQRIPVFERKEIDVEIPHGFVNKSIEEGRFLADNGEGSRLCFPLPDGEWKIEKHMQNIVTLSKNEI